MLRLKSNISSEDWHRLTSCSKSQEEDTLAANMFQRKHSWLSEQIQHLHVDDQLVNFTTLMTMSQDDFRKRDLVRNDLLSILGQRYQNIKIIRTADVITGLGDSESILNLFVGLQGIPDSYKYMRNIIENIHQMLISTKEFCNQVSLVENNPLPYINGIHSTTEVKMQICFNNFISVQSARLIEFMISLDTRVLPLMLIIRYWASYNIQPPNFIDNYILELLILVFLNKCKILPNVAFLQLQCKTTAVMPLFKNFWNVSFSLDRQLITEILSTSGRAPIEYSDVTGKPTAKSILLLAKSFFRMYADVDFRRTAVCSLLGSFIMKSDLDVDNKNARLPELLQQYTNWSLFQNKKDRMKIDTAMCVQDPFELGRNVAENVTESSLLAFQNACRNSIDSLERLEQRARGSGCNYNFLDFITMKEENNVQYTARVGLKRRRPSSTVVKSESEVQNYVNSIPEGQTNSCSSLAKNNAVPVQVRSHITFNEDSKLHIEDSLRGLHISPPVSKSSASDINCQGFSGETSSCRSLSTNYAHPPVRSYITFEEDSKMHIADSLSRLHISLPLSNISESDLNCQGPQVGFSGSIMQPTLNNKGRENFSDNTCSNAMGQLAKYFVNTPTRPSLAFPVIKMPKRDKPRKLPKAMRKEKARQKLLHNKTKGTAPDGIETYELRINQCIRADFSYCFNFFFKHVASKAEIDQKCKALWLSFFNDFFNDVWSIAFKVRTEPHDPTEVLGKLYTDRPNTKTVDSYSTKQIRKFSNRVNSNSKVGARLMDKVMKECQPDPGDEDEEDDEESNLNPMMASQQKYSRQFASRLMKFQQLPVNEKFCKSLLVHGRLDTMAKSYELRHTKKYRLVDPHPLKRCGKITERVLYHMNIPAVHKKFIATAKVDTTKNPMEILLIFTETTDCQGMGEIFINLFKETKKCLAQYQIYRLTNWLNLKLKPK